MDLFAMPLGIPWPPGRPAFNKHYSNREGSMFSKLHNRLGTAGLVVAVVALIAALAGTAFAAAGLNSTQKKETEKIAKKYAGKKGATGPAGSAGAQGPAGAKGDAGSIGSEGKAGASGKSVKTTEFSGVHAGCAEGRGGSEIEVEGSGTKTYACNGKEGKEGKEGKPWTPNNVLPANATETGSWEAQADAGGEAFTPISFFIPLAAELDENHVAIHVVGYDGEDKIGTEHENCPGKATNPKAKSGFLCVYTGREETALISAIEKIATAGGSNLGASTSGARISRIITEPNEISAGTFAVTG